MKTAGYGKIFVLVSTLMLSLVNPAQADTLTAFVDRNQIAIDETLLLSVRIDSQALFGKPDFSSLAQDFEVRGNSQNRQMRSINGKSESWTQCQLTLAPKRQGQLRIPAFELKGARSQPIVINVSALPPATAASDRDYFMEMEVDKSEVYMQEQLMVRIRLHSAISLTGLQGTPLTLDNAKVVKLDEKQYERLANGRRYGVYEVSYVVFPQKSGTLSIPEQHFIAHKTTGRSRFGRSTGARVSLSTEAKDIRVLAPPASIPVSQWLPLSSLQLSQSWGQGQPEFRVGEPITRTLILQAKGVEAAFFEPTELAHIPGVRIYPEQPEVEEQLTDSGYEVTRTERFGLVPSQAGELKLPAIKLLWWDTVAKQERLAELPAQVIQVLPVLGVANPPVQPQAQPLVAPQQVTLPESPAALPIAPGFDWLLWSNLLWMLVCTMLALLWWRARQSAMTPKTVAALADNQSSGVAEAQAFKRFEQTCDLADLVAIRNALIYWLGIRADVSMGESGSPQTLDQLAQESNDRRLTELLQTLDSQIYGDKVSDSYPVEQLLQQIRLLRKSAAANPQQSADDLPDLYAV